MNEKTVKQQLQEKIQDIHEVTSSMSHDDLLFETKEIIKFWQRWLQEHECIGNSIPAKAQNAFIDELLEELEKGEG